MMVDAQDISLAYPSLRSRPGFKSWDQVQSLGLRGTGWGFWGSMWFWASVFRVQVQEPGFNI